MEKSQEKLLGLSTSLQYVKSYSKYFECYDLAVGGVTKLCEINFWDNSDLFWHNFVEEKTIFLLINLVSCLKVVGTFTNNKGGY